MVINIEYSQIANCQKVCSIRVREGTTAGTAWLSFTPDGVGLQMRQVIIWRIYNMFSQSVVVYHYWHTALIRN